MRPILWWCFACAPGERAVELPTDEHSVFTKHLLKHLQTPNQRVEYLFVHVRNGVREETRRTLPRPQNPCCDYALQVTGATLAAAAHEADAPDGASIGSSNDAP